jgi:hypothetical protein
LLALVLVVIFISVIQTNAIPVPDGAPPEATSTYFSPPVSTVVSSQCQAAFDDIKNSPLEGCRVKISQPLGPNSSAILLDETDLNHFCTSSDCEASHFSSALSTLKSECADDLDGDNIATFTVHHFSEIPLLINLGCLKNSTGGYCAIESQNDVRKYYMDNNLRPSGGPGNFSAMINELPADIICTTCTKDSLSALADVDTSEHPGFDDFLGSIKAKCPQFSN